MNDSMEDDFDGHKWFSFCQRLLVAKELLFSRNDPEACHNSIITGDIYFQELINTENGFHFSSAV
jgi:hypothetical protein